MAKIVYVDENDNVVGAGTIAEANEKGVGRRIARIFLYNSKGETLIQKRSDKVRMPNLWDHGAAGHVDEGESYMTAAYRELKEELGVTGVELTEVMKVRTDNPHVPGLVNFSMLYTGNYDGPFVLDTHEVAEVKWITVEDLLAWTDREPDTFPPGFITSLNELLKFQNQK